MVLEEATTKERKESSLYSENNREMIDEAIEQGKICLKLFGNVKKSAYRSPKPRNDTKLTSKVCLL